MLSGLASFGCPVFAHFEDFTRSGLSFDCPEIDRRDPRAAFPIKDSTMA